MATCASTIELLVTSRRVRNALHAAITSWMLDAAARGELVRAEQAPGWVAYAKAEHAWLEALLRLDMEIADEQT